MIDQKALESKKVKKAALLKYAGIAKGDTDEKSIQDIKTEKKEKYR